MGTWIELRCEDRGETWAEGIERERCWSHDNEGPMGEAEDNRAGLLETMRRLEIEAKELGWNHKRSGWICPHCSAAAASQTRKGSLASLGGELRNGLRISLTVPFNGTTMNSSKTCPEGSTMSLEVKANIAILAALEALSLMSKKSGVEPKTIMDAILADPEGNTARYFSELVLIAMREVPKLLAA